MRELKTDPKKPTKLLVITDLDSTLLNEDYSFMEAWGVMRQLKLQGFPIVFNSSKTLAEMEVLAQEMGLHAPMVAENGGVLCLPVSEQWQDSIQSGTVKEAMEYEACGNYWVHTPGLDRERILAVAHQLREAHGYDFEGYGDWSVEDVVEHTGLDPVSAQQSLQRVATEPILWQDSEEAWVVFEKQLVSEGIRVLKGGRFLHLMGEPDKADGLRSIQALYAHQEPDVQWLTVVLGDSENDLGMLSAADIAVVIPREDGVEIEPVAVEVIRPKGLASAGWAEAMRLILERVERVRIREV